MTQKKAIIIGAGPAGLTAAYELLKRTDIKPIVLEMSGEIGGISKTINYKGNRIDIGGHRFFSKSDRVMQWWQNILPVQGKLAKDDLLLDRKLPLASDSSVDPEKIDQVMLIRNRLSRIFFLRKFFNYPVSLSVDTLLNLGFICLFKIGFGYLKVIIWPIKEVKTLEDFFTNRFGRELYLTFFKDYTEKVWGVPCNQIEPEWGAQRVKGLSITKTMVHALKKIISPQSLNSSQNVETSLIEQFFYPKFGPGHIWQEVPKLLRGENEQILMNHEVVEIQLEDDKLKGIEVLDHATGQSQIITGDYFFSTMPVKDLIDAMGKRVPEPVKDVAKGLVYRDFITVGLLLKKLKIENKSGIATVNNIVPDNWIYIQERDVKIGRLQIFNNWSPYMVKDQNTVWMGLEYFCNEGDNLWSMADQEFSRFAIDELAKIDIINKTNVLDSVVIRVPKTYPAYFGTYEKFPTIRDFVDRIENLFLIGRNGMHRYNNADHSMLTAMVAVDNIVEGIKSKENIWSVNTEEEYHEEKR